jgi:hypothetical protein
MSTTLSQQRRVDDDSATLLPWEIIAHIVRFIMPSQRWRLLTLVSHGMRALVHAHTRSLLVHLPHWTEQLSCLNEQPNWHSLFSRLSCVHEVNLVALGVTTWCESQGAFYANLLWALAACDSLRVLHVPRSVAIWYEHEPPILAQVDVVNFSCCKRFNAAARVLLDADTSLRTVVLSPASIKCTNYSRCFQSKCNARFQTAEPQVIRQAIEYSVEKDTDEDRTSKTSRKRVNVERTLELAERLAARVFPRARYVCAGEYVGTYLSASKHVGCNSSRACFIDTDLQNNWMINDLNLAITHDDARLASLEALTIRGDVGYSLIPRVSATLRVLAMYSLSFTGMQTYAMLTTLPVLPLLESFSMTKCSVTAGVFCGLLRACRMATHVHFERVTTGVAMDAVVTLSSEMSTRLVAALGAFTNLRSLTCEKTPIVLENLHAMLNNAAAAISLECLSLSYTSPSDVPATVFANMRTDRLRQLSLPVFALRLFNPAARFDALCSFKTAPLATHTTESFEDDVPAFLRRLQPGQLQSLELSMYACVFLRSYVELISADVLHVSDEHFLAVGMSANMMLTPFKRLIYAGSVGVLDISAITPLNYVSQSFPPLAYSDAAMAQFILHLVEFANALNHCHDDAAARVRIASRKWSTNAHDLLHEWKNDSVVATVSQPPPQGTVRRKLRRIVIAARHAEMLYTHEALAATRLFSPAHNDEHSVHVLVANNRTLY